jgi:hypothetical protein
LPPSSSRDDFRFWPTFAVLVGLTTAAFVTAGVTFCLQTGSFVFDDVAAARLGTVFRAGEDRLLKLTVTSFELLRPMLFVQTRGSWLYCGPEHKLKLVVIPASGL